jgi:transcription initiation factor TFIID subunit 6
VHYVEDEEIDFNRALREEKTPLPEPTNWTAHWLAVEGIQLLIPVNPPAIPRNMEGEAGKGLLCTQIRIPFVLRCIKVGFDSVSSVHSP